MALSARLKAEIIAALLVRWLMVTEGAPFSAAEDIPSKIWKTMGKLEPWGGGRRGIERAIVRMERSR